MLGNEEFPVAADDEKHHPTIVKNGKNGVSQNGNGTKEDLGPMSEAANVNPDLSTVTWTANEKSDQDSEKEPLKKETIA